VEIGGKALEGSFYSNHYFAGDPQPAVRQFVEKYRERFGQTPDSLAALGYDAAKVLADAMRKAGQLEGPSIRDQIAATKDFPGVTGAITLGPDRNPTGKRLVILEVKNGEVELKDTIDASGTVMAPPTTTDTSPTAVASPGT
jgi:branched-chain amino acid transport system substrate-binding protein